MNGLTASEQSYPRAACSAPAGPPPLIGRMLSPVWRRVHFLLAVSQHHHQSPLQVTSPPIPSHSFAACHTHSLLTIPELAAPSYFALSTISKPAALLSSLQSLPQSTSAVRSSLLFPFSTDFSHRSQHGRHYVSLLSNLLLGVSLGISHKFQ